MYLYKNVLCIVFLSAAVSCNTNSVKEAEISLEKTTTTEKKSGRSLDDSISNQMMDMFGMEGDGFQDMMGADSLQLVLMQMFSGEGLKQMIKTSNLSATEQELMIRKWEETVKNQSTASSTDLPNHTEEKIKEYFSELEKVLAASGSSQQLKDLQAMMSKPNVQAQLDRIGEPNVSAKEESIRKALGTNASSFIEEDLTKRSFYGATQKRELLRSLTGASAEEGKKAIGEYYGVTDKEVDLLKNLPAFDKLTSSGAAKKKLNFEMPPTIAAYLKNGKPSQKFKILTSNFVRDAKLNASQFLARAETAKHEFESKNPGWHSNKDNEGETYIDSRGKMIYLPFGPLSFADKVISHSLGKPAGSHAQGAIGPPDFALELFNKADARICNLGERGVLTLQFTNNAISDVNGPDLYIFEMGQVEPTNLEISKNNKDWINVGQIKGGTAMVDIGPFIKKGETYTYVRLTDLASGSALPGADVDAVAAIGGALRLNLDAAVLFETGKFNLKANAAGELQKLLTALKVYPGATIVVEGHTDDVGNPQSNLALSENRAGAVAAFLKKHLSASFTIGTKGNGESQPIVPNTNEENRQKNRRVEILVIPR